MSDNELTYKSAGVDIDAGNRLVNNIKPFVKKTHRKEVLSSLGGFNGLCEVPANYKEPLLVSGTDGVGTKLMLANELGTHTTIGIDLVAMCVNDMLTCGAEPLFFLDYFATGHLEVNTASDVVKGISEGCLQAGCALIGGETAEMPGLYKAHDYDLAGFSVGVVEKTRVVNGKNTVTSGDVIIGLASTGLHSNGYSLVRKLIEQSGVSLLMSFDNCNLGETLLTPTQIYVKAVLPLAQSGQLSGMAHITGGGLLENIPRAIPNTLKATLDSKKWQKPKIFNWIQEVGSINRNEMLRTFNCGIGFVLITKPAHVKAILAHFSQHQIPAWQIGEISERTENEPSIQIF